MSNSEVTDQIHLLDKAIRHLKGCNTDALTLEPLIPGSLAIRAARLRSSELPSSDKRAVDAESLLLPEPYAWYVSRQAVPDHFAARVRLKHLPHTLIFCESLDELDLDTLEIVLRTAITTQGSIFIATPPARAGERSVEPAIKQSVSDLMESLKHITECHHVELENPSDKLSLIKHAHLVISDSIGEIGDAITLGIPCSTYERQTGKSLLTKPSSTNANANANKFEVTRSEFKKYISERLKGHDLIRTHRDLAMATRAAKRDEDDKQTAEAPDEWAPILPLTLPGLTLTQRQKRDLVVAKYVRKSRKFRESPKRFFSESRLLSRLK